MILTITGTFRRKKKGTEKTDFKTIIDFESLRQLAVAESIRSSNDGSDFLFKFIPNYKHSVIVKNQLINPDLE